MWGLMSGVSTGEHQSTSRGAGRAVPLTWFNCRCLRLNPSHELQARRPPLAQNASGPISLSFGRNATERELRVMEKPLYHCLPINGSKRTVRVSREAHDCLVGIELCKLSPTALSTSSVTLLLVRAYIVL